MGLAGDLALGIGLNVANEAGNLLFGEAKMKQQLKGQKQALAQQNAAQYDMWLKTNYSAQRRELEKAGLNPGLLYGMGGGGGATTGSASAMPSNQGGNLDIGQAAQLALLKAQKENIEADTANKQAEAVKKAGVDTDLGRGQIANLAAQTKNTAAQTELTGVETRIRQMQEDILDATQYYEIGKAKEEYMKLANEVRSAAAKGDIDQATVEQKIRQESIKTTGMLLDNLATSKGIELNDAQIDKINAEIDTMYKNAETGRMTWETQAKESGVRISKILTESGGEIDVDKILNILLGIGAASQFGRGGKGSPKLAPGQGRAKARYDKWGTKTSPTGYDLK